MLQDRDLLVREAGGWALTGEVVDLPESLHGIIAARLDTLTPREFEILGLIAQGRSNAAIAEELFVTKRAVERHINSIFAKLDLREADDVSRRVKAALLYLAGDA